MRTLKCGSNSFIFLEVMVLGSYIHFTQEQKAQAASVDLEDFLRERGETLLSSGKDKRLASDHSVTIRGNAWYDHAEEKGGYAISFVQKHYRLSYAEAVTMLLNSAGCTVPQATKRQTKAGFILPPASKNMRRVFAYLVKSRGIERDILAAFAREKLIYEDTPYHNAVFVGTDGNGIPRHAHKRSTGSEVRAFRQNVEGSDPRFSFNRKGTDGSLYVFEAPIDMLSYITLHPEDWEMHSYVACCGTSFLPVQQILERLPQFETVLLCLDNDEAGHAACLRMTDQLKEQYIVERLISKNKDWNDDLIAEKQEVCIP